MTNFSAKTISFSATHQLPKLFIDYISAAETLRPFYSFFPDDEGYAAAAKSMRYDESIRKTLVDVIREQYSTTGIPINETLISNLEKEGALTVCTGHQLCLFTGPLYFIYKIITTIKLAEEQSKALGKIIVPVYWMASEDHDFDEVRSVNLYGKTLKWDADEKGAVGKFKTDSLSAVLAELKTLIGENIPADNLFAIISNAYRPGRTLAQATREFVNALFAGKVLILDADDARLKKFLVPTIKAELEKQEAEQLISASIAKLTAMNYEVQVNPRKINLFYMKDDLRERIEGHDGNFKVLNTSISFTHDELISEVENHPEYFSPNVVMRPVYQQIILPNLAYVGGPGELTYWMEYKSMFDQFTITFPVLQQRHSALVLDKNSEERLGKLGIAAEDLFGDVEVLIKEYVRKISGDSLSFETEKETLRQLFETLREKIAPVDPTLKGAADAELQKQLNALENLEGKVLRAAKQKQEASVTQIRKLREKLLPAGVLQERYENFIPFWLKYGDDFITQLSSEFNFPVEGVLLLSEKQ